MADGTFNFRKCDAFMNTVHAIYENGIFRPLTLVDLPEHAEVKFEPRQVHSEENQKAAEDRIWDRLAERFQSGEHDVAARHNEHQP